jgi:cytochrome c-type biogenesis protein CcmE
MNKTSLAIVALVIVAATAIGFYAFAQNAQASSSSLSFSQSNKQRSSTLAGIISNSNVGNQLASNTFCFEPTGGGNTCGIS